MSSSLPTAPDAERALLGGLLQLASPEWSESVRRLIPDDFADPLHQFFFSIMQGLMQASRIPDLVTVSVVLFDQGKRDDVPALQELPSYAPTLETLDQYANIVREKSILRRYILDSQELIRAAHEGPDDVSAFLGVVARLAAELQLGTSDAKWSQLSEVMDENLVKIDDLRVVFEAKRAAGLQNAVLTGLPTGLNGLDMILFGLQKTDLLILAARPGMGKTSLALNMAMAAAKHRIGGVSPVVAIFSLEMGREQLVTRLLCSEARVDASKLRVGDVLQHEMDHLTEHADRLRNLKLFLYDQPGLTLQDVRGLTRKLVAEAGRIDFVIIDYLQLMSGDDKRASREQVISGLSRGLKGMAKELKIPVLALSQLNRRIDERQDKRPKLSDLRESGAIEQDADIILFIHRDDAAENKDEAEVVVAKHRAGATGEVPVAFQRQFTRFSDLVVSDHDEDFD